jgi:betaine-aldehyde dehydrogenase
MFAETIQLLNENRSGLGAVLRSNDPRLIKTFFEQVRAETIWINDPLTDIYAGPCGGMKMSSNAREPGLEGLDNFLETRHA